MIEILDEYLFGREFSGRVIVSFDRGVVQNIRVEEQIAMADTERVNKLLTHGIRVKGNRNRTPGLPVAPDLPTAASSHDAR